MQAAVIAGATAIGTGLEAVLTAVAPIALGVMVGVAGVRLVAKLVNRVVGK